MSTFPGFLPPSENWSKLPHELIDAMAGMNAAELKVVLYILRHTWGYGDALKQISIDEFCKGRQRADGSRIDNGCGLSPNSVRSGLDAAVQHGMITVTVDDSDAARIRKFYAIRMAGESGVQNLRAGVQKLNPDAQKLNPGLPKIEHRTEKETLERNSVNSLSTPGPAAAEFSDPRIILSDPVQGPKQTVHEQAGLDPRQLSGGLYAPGEGDTPYRVYREVFDYTPGRTVIQAMNETVGNDPAALQRWRDVLKAYALSGKTSAWVKVQLEWFRDGIPAAWDPNQTRKATQNGNANANAPRRSDRKSAQAGRGNGLGLSVLDLPEDEQSRIAALLGNRDGSQPGLAFAAD